PGSGEPTRAREWVDADPAHRARVSRDDLRMMMHGRLAWGQTWQEDQVTTAQHAAIAALLAAGTSVVVDATNLTARRRPALAEPVDVTADLLVLVGLPGSGKSTLARRWVDADLARRARVSRDDLRMMMHGRLAWEQRWQEGQVTVAQHAAAAALLGDGISVVADATNLTARHREALAELARAAGARVVVQVVDTPVAECITRDAARPPGRRVGADVIRRLARAAEWPVSEQA